ncbi:MAG TPA: extracellular solute-binding protein [Candidatus Acidoferrales bacterium]|nr:extracellular solute-binding protein [Candidatus Acidoferrales bacterium]
MMLGAIVFLLAAAVPAFAQQKGWEKEWNETLAAAKKEGRVAVAGSPDPVMRNEIIPKFTSRFGIPVEFIAGRASQYIQKIKTERSAGIYSVDIFMTGVESTVNTLYAEKLIDPLRPLMILPEVVDGSKWKTGKLWFIDPEERFVLRVFRSVNGLFFYNADHVKAEEVRALKDLLNPKWRGKISSDDPLVSGTGAANAAMLYVQLGPEFVKRLYVDQKPVFSRERRQYTDWLARGTYPICLNCRADDARPLIKEGFKLVEVFEVTDARSQVNGSPWLLTLANKAPHPNAARVFANWIASKEGLEIYSRGYGAATLRTDVDESFLDPASVPRAGVNYFDDSDWSWATTGRREAREKMQALLREHLKR